MSARSPIIPVILCGGAGTRLWPLSRRLEPKQFQRLMGERTLLQQTLERFNSALFARPLVLANAKQEEMLHRDTEGAHASEARQPLFLLEPAIRSTAPAIAAASVVAYEQDDPLMIVAPSDHFVARPDELVDAIAAAAPFARQQGIALFGIEPRSPHTGFGYIEFGKEIDAQQTHVVREVARFLEKPDAKTAAHLLAMGNFLWNSGMFLFRASTMLEELRKYAPDVLKAAGDAVRLAERDGKILRLHSSFAGAPNVPIDTAVMEKSARLGVVPVAPGWDDLGTFDALRRCGDRDEANNGTVGEVLIENVANSYVRADSRIVCVHGVDGLAVVETADAVLVGPLDDANGLKQIVQSLRDRDHPAGQRHSVANASYGVRQILAAEDGAEFSRLTIEPAREASLEILQNGMSRTVTLLRGEVEVRDRGRPTNLNTGEPFHVAVSDVVRVKNNGTEPAFVLVCTLPAREGAPQLEKAS